MPDGIFAFSRPGLVTTSSQVAAASTVTVSVRNCMPYQNGVVSVFLSIVSRLSPFHLCAVAMLVASQGQGDVLGVFVYNVLQSMQFAKW